MKQEHRHFTQYWGLWQPLFCRTRNMEAREQVLPSLNEDSFQLKE